MAVGLGMSKYLDRRQLLIKYGESLIFCSVEAFYFYFNYFLLFRFQFFRCPGGVRDGTFRSNNRNKVAVPGLTMGRRKRARGQSA